MHVSHKGIKRNRNSRSPHVGLALEARDKILESVNCATGFPRSRRSKQVAGVGRGREELVMGGGEAGNWKGHRIKFSHLVVFYFLALNVAAHFKVFFYRLGI